MVPDSLLVGPRGRRLLLECVRLMAQEHSSDDGWSLVSALHRVSLSIDSETVAD